MAKHVDDLKLAGPRPEATSHIQKLEAVLGTLKSEWNSSTKCGANRVQDPTTKEVTLDQCEYAKGYVPSLTSSSPARNRRRLVALSCAVSTVSCWGLSCA
eukprot:6612398-Alexandrium_andersonii.AAC.1